MWWADKGKRWEVVSQCMDSQFPFESAGLAAMYVHGVGCDVMKSLSATPGVKPKAVIPALSHVDFSDLIVEFGKAVGRDEASRLVVDWHWNAARGADDVVKRLASHGVSVPVALARAGHVYGVGPDQDSQFVEIAKAITTPDQVVERAGLTFVTRWASGVSAAETVSKAAQDQFMREGELVRVNRDQDGKFATQNAPKEQEVEAAPPGIFAAANSPVTPEQAKSRRRARADQYLADRQKVFERNQAIFDELDAKLAAEREQAGVDEKKTDDGGPTDEQKQMMELLALINEINDVKNLRQMQKLAADARALNIDNQRKYFAARAAAAAKSANGTPFFVTDTERGYFGADWERKVYEDQYGSSMTHNVVHARDVTSDKIKFGALGRLSDEEREKTFAALGGAQPNFMQGQTGMYKYEIPLWLAWPALQQTAEAGKPYIDVGRVNAALALTGGEDMVRGTFVDANDLNKDPTSTEYKMFFAPIANKGGKLFVNIYTDDFNDKPHEVTLPSGKNVAAPGTVLQGLEDITGYLDNFMKDALKAGMRLSKRDSGWVDDDNNSLFYLNNTHAEDFTVEAITAEKGWAEATSRKSNFNDKLSDKILGQLQFYTDTHKSISPTELFEKLEISAVEDFTSRIYSWKAFNDNFSALPAYWKNGRRYQNGELAPGVGDVIDRAEHYQHPFSDWDGNKISSTKPTYAEAERNYFAIVRSLLRSKTFAESHFQPVVPEWVLPKLPRSVDATSGRSAQEHAQDMVRGQLFDFTDSGRGRKELWIANGDGTGTLLGTYDASFVNPLDKAINLSLQMVMGLWNEVTDSTHLSPSSTFVAKPDNHRYTIMQEKTRNYRIRMADEILRQQFPDLWRGKPKVARVGNTTTSPTVNSSYTPFKGQSSQTIGQYRADSNASLATDLAYLTMFMSDPTLFESDLEPDAAKKLDEQVQDGITFAWYGTTIAPSNKGMFSSGGELLSNEDQELKGEMQEIAKNPELEPDPWAYDPDELASYVFPFEMVLNRSLGRTKEGATETYGLHATGGKLKESAFMAWPNSEVFGPRKK